MGDNKNFETLVSIERIRQEEKWGEQNHNFYIWFTILGEEVGELAKAILEFDRTKHIDPVVAGQMEKELVQIAAVAKAMWESGRRNGWL